MNKHRNYLIIDIGTSFVANWKILHLTLLIKVFFFFFSRGLGLYFWLNTCSEFIFLQRISQAMFGLVFCIVISEKKKNIIYFIYVWNGIILNILYFVWDHLAQLQNKSMLIPLSRHCKTICFTRQNKKAFRQ